MIQDCTLRVSYLGCSRDEQLLFKPVSFALQAGEGLIVEGPNGVGKTTLLRVLSGLLPQACGEINCSLPIREHVAYLGPHNAVKGLLTPLEYLKYYTKSQDTVDFLQGLEYKPCAMLSSGQKQRVALARVVLSNAKLWILDEPMTALDKVGEILFANLLQTHLSAGGIAIIATHQKIALDHLQKLMLEPK